MANHKPGSDTITNRVATAVTPGKDELGFFEFEQEQPKLKDTRAEEQFTFPAPNMPQSSLDAIEKDDFLWDSQTQRMDTINFGKDSFLSDVSDEVEDFGLTSTVIDVVADALQLESSDDDAQVLRAGINKLITKYQLPDAFQDNVIENAKNINHAETLIKRTKRRLIRSKGREQMGLGRSIGVGLAGFVADPTNLIPGALLWHSGASLMKFSATQALRQQLSRTAVGKVVTDATALAAFSAAEQAFRTLPRLQSDATFGYEEYKTHTGYAALMGGGIVAAIPITKLLATGSSRAVQSALRKSAMAAQESATARTGVNIVTGAADAAKTAYKGSSSVRDFVNSVRKEDIVRNARDKTNSAIKENAILKTVRNSAEDFGGNTVTFKEAAVEGIVAFSKKLADSIKSILPDSNIKEAFDNIVSKSEQTPKSGGAAARTETTETVAGDAASDLSQIIRDNNESLKKSIKEINELETIALLEVQKINKSTGVDRLRAELEIKAAAQETRDAVVARLEREGITAQRTKIKPGSATAAISNAVNKAVQAETSKELKGLVQKLGLPPGVLHNKTISRILTRVGTKGLPEGKRTISGLLEWIQAKPELVSGRTNLTRDAVSREYDRALERLEDVYIGNPADRDFLRTKQILEDNKTQLENAVDYIGMLHENMFNDLASLSPKWALLSEEYETTMGAANRAILQEQYNTLAQQFISNQFGKLTASQSAELVRTEVPLAEWFALNILELPAGTGGTVARQETAAILSNLMEDAIQVPLNKAWFDMIDEAAEQLGKGNINRAFMRTQNANESQQVKDIARQVMLEMNQRQQGITAIESNMPNYIKRFADRLEEANEKAYQLQLDNGVDGITGANKMKSYMKQVWNDGAISEMLQNPAVGKDAVIELLGKSLKSRAGDKLTKQEAQDLAESVIATKIQNMGKPQFDAFKIRSENNVNAMSSIEDVLAHMNSAGKQRSIDAILKYTQETNLGGPSYTNKRFLNLDYSTEIAKDGKVISIMDLLDSDVVANANRYNKEAAGRSALARASGGKLRSEQDINEFIGSLAIQNAELGANVDVKGVRNVLRQIVGLPVDGALAQDIRKARDAVSLAGMGGLGESQLAETGLALNRGLAGLWGAAQVARKYIGQAKQFMGMKLTTEQQQSTKFLGELQEFSKLYENMHHLARNNVHFDVRENQNAQSVFSKVVSGVTGGKYRPTLQYLQTRATLYSSIRTMQEQLAMAGLMQDAIKFVRVPGSSFTSANRFSDIGLDLNLVRKKLDDNTIQLADDGTIATLNMERWSQDEIYTLGTALRRHSAQQVQTGFAGESSTLMMNPTVALMMQFKSYPLLAAEKQMGRNAMFGDKEAAMGIVLNSLSSAAARYVRYVSLSNALPEDKREAYVNRRLERDWGHDTLAYMGIVGSMVNSYDMVRDLGFGDRSIASQVPMLNWANNYMKAAKAATSTDELTQRDIGTIQRGMPLGTIGNVNIISGIIRTMMETDAEAAQVNKEQNRGN